MSVYSHQLNASIYIANKIAEIIRRKEKLGQKTVLGLATGASPVLIYKELVKLHKTEGLSFRNVITFNLDEYYPMNPENLQSYVYFMDQFFLIILTFVKRI